MTEAATTPSLTRPPAFDPRTSLAAFVSVAVWITTTRGLRFTALWALALIITVIWLRLSGRLPGIRLRSITAWVLLSAAITILLYWLFGPQVEEPVASVFGYPISRASLAAGGAMAMRLTSLILLAICFISSTGPLELAAGLSRLLHPLSRFGAPTAQVYYLSFFLARSLPALAGESRIIRMAQQSRGIRTNAGFLGRVRAAPSLVIPTFAAALARADRITLALTARGFDVNRVPADVQALRFTARDYLIFTPVLTGWVIWSTITLGSL